MIPVRALRSALSGDRLWRWTLRLLPWLAVPGVWLAFRAGQYVPKLTPGFLVVLPFVLVALLAIVRFPQRAVAVLIVELPLTVVGSAWLYKKGVPGGVALQLFRVKDLIFLGVVIAAVLAHVRGGRATDRADRLATGYLLLIATFLVAPALLAQAAPMPLDARFEGFREAAQFVIMFLAARRLPWSEVDVRRVERALLFLALALAASAVWEYIDRDGWANFVHRTISVPRFNREVRGVTTHQLGVVAVFGEGGSLRAGTLLIDPLSGGFAMLAGLAVACHRAVSGRAGPWLAVAGFIAAGVLFTGTRSALLGAIVIFLLSVGSRAGQSARGRIQFVALLAVGLVFAAPSIGESNVADRTVSAAEGTDTSADSHWFALRAGVEQSLRAPFGLGLGGVEEYRGKPVYGTENYYLQVSNQTGIASMVLFVGLVVTAARGVRRSGRPGHLPAWTAFVGLSVGALLLHTWAQLEVSVPAWMFLGIALGAPAVSEERPSRTPLRVPLRTATG